MFTLLWILGLGADHYAYTGSIYVPGYYTDAFGDFYGIPNCDIAVMGSNAYQYTCIICSKGYNRVLKTADNGRLYYDCEEDEPVPTPEVLECPTLPPIPTCEE